MKYDYRKMVVVQSAGAAAAAEGKPIESCPYSKDTNMMEYYDWTSGYHTYRAEKAAIDTGSLIYASTHSDGRGWKVPLAEAVRAGQFNPQYVPLPAGLTPGPRREFDANKEWKKYQVDDPFGWKSAGISIPSTMRPK